MSAHFRSWHLARGVTVALALLAIAATKGPDGGSYSATDEVVYSMLDLSGSNGGVSVLSGVDDGVVALTLPFPFRFYGTPYTRVCVSSNGAIYFVATVGACATVNDFGNVDITTTSTPNDLPAALPLWSDLTFEVPGAGSVLYKTIGAVGSRRFVIQWHNAYPQGSTAPVTFQAVLSEGVHTLLFQYETTALGAGNPANMGGAATVGIRNTQAVSTNKLLSWSYNAPVIANSSALSFSAPDLRVTGDVNEDGVVNCVDTGIVKKAYGKRISQAGYDAQADLNGDGIVNLRDLTTVTRALPAGTKCP